MDPFSDVEDHAVEVCVVFVDRGIWRLCGERVKRVRELVRERK